MRWQFWIDRGGTFTDCIGLDPATRSLRVTKVLSSDRAPLEGIHKLLGLAPDAPIPACDVRMGTTIATNALLERRGVNTALAITRGFGDLLHIGDQTRPDLFALDIERPPSLASLTIEHSGRCAPDQRVLHELDEGALAPELARARAQGCRSLAVVVMHDYAEGKVERRIAELARAQGFSHVVCSHEVSPQLGLLARTETTVVDAYLTPLLEAYLEAMSRELPGSRLRMMQSSGGLTDAKTFRGRDAVLSGPAGGAVALLELARRTGEREVIGFDMGGTSTDVARCAGELPRVYESKVSGVRLRAPMMDIHTIAAGGGSLCRFDGHKLSVGPESAGALPGPLCYGHARAQELALTDVHLVLGRLVGDRFPFALDEARVHEALAALTRQVAHSQPGLDDPMRVAEGFFEIAVESMSDAIRRVTIARGHDVRTHALVVFGGAAGQAACSVARRLGITRLLVHPLSGVLSAYGMGVADDTWHGERDLGCAPLGEATLSEAERAFASLAAEAQAALAAQGADPSQVRFERRLDLRYAGTETALNLPEGPLSSLHEAFHALHAQTFGYARPEHAIEVVVARLEARVTPALDDVLPRLPSQEGEPLPVRRSRLYVGGAWLDDVPVFDRDRLGAGARIVGPALVLDATGTLVLEPDFEAALRADGVLVVTDVAPGQRASVQASGREARDPVLLEVFNHLFMSVAEQMGVVLRRTALSTNIRERMDFSCAVFDAASGLVANAPHIPVHLGAMAESVRAVLEAHPQPEPGDVFVTNDPSLGGSHLPDITVVSPVHGPDGRLRYVCASRGHHADIGGITPGSMPPDSKTLAEEGVVLSALRIVHRGTLDRELVLRTLGSGPYPARNPRENLADLEAQVAANRTGARLLSELDERFGHARVAAYMQHIQDNAAESVQAAVRGLADGSYAFSDALDDGTPLCVRIEVKQGSLSIDFSGTGGEHAENLNAPRAVTVASVLYVLRCLVGKPIPLNSGCLRHVQLHVPSPSLLSPSPDRAVVAGNVETSQRVVDVLLGALGLAAASQGTMNNFTFGNERFGYYETIAGGAGATARAPGASAVHTHMTNTRITDPEVLERRFPVRLVRFALRPGSGGAGLHPGGQGVVRELEALEPMTVSFLTERRLRAPFGLAGGQDAQPGRNFINDQELPGRVARHVQPGDRVRLETPGGGGFGRV